jgi:23S rRNA (cytidine1920-2'-O)/16S rRNA (cytidine1409-2'-O)-methyltransferase
MKIRLDNYLVEKGIALTRSKAQAIIMSGQVFVDAKLIDKAGYLVKEEQEVIVKETYPYVSRGASKLEQAYHVFKLNFENKVICDIGSSTGGFTDFALQHGVKKAYCIDVGRGQLAQNLREDKRVITMEKTDFRSIEKLPDNIDYYLCDVSFISLKKILPKIKEIAGQSTKVIALIKPQFEAGAREASKGKGVIKDEAVRLKIVENIKEFSTLLGFTIHGLTESPILGAKGNKEYLIYLELI